MRVASAVGDCGVAASVTGFDSAGETDCCVVPHPTSTTAAIVVSRRCFMSPKAELNCVLFAIVLNVHMKIFMQYKKGQYAHA